jgi:hypothetical protein
LVQHEYNILLRKMKFYVIIIILHHNVVQITIVW